MKQKGFTLIELMSAKSSHAMPFFALILVIISLYFA
ncbi:prepilin-type N-terminal cleavage/methylation domain-containing protein [Vibrio sp. 10N.247.311.51]